MIFIQIINGLSGFNYLTEINAKSVKAGHGAEMSDKGCWEEVMGEKNKGLLCGQP